MPMTFDKAVKSPRYTGLMEHHIARVHRGGRVLMVVWNDGVSPACWQAVNDGLVERLTSR